jgi:hypothetical protein
MELDVGVVDLENAFCVSLLDGTDHVEHELLVRLHVATPPSMAVNAPDATT